MTDDKDDIFAENCLFIYFFSDYYCSAQASFALISGAQSPFVEPSTQQFCEFHDCNIFMNSHYIT